MEDPIPIRIAIVGDPTVGKTTFVNKFAGRDYSVFQPSFYESPSFTIKLDNQIIFLNIQDAFGIQPFKFWGLIISRCDIALILFSVIDPNSFKNVTKIWIPELDKVSPTIMKIVIGNKIDLREEYMQKELDHQKRPISQEAARKVFEEELNIKYLECSSLQLDKITEIFKQTMRLFLKNKVPKIVHTNDKHSCQLI